MRYYEILGKLMKEIKVHPQPLKSNIQIYLAPYYIDIGNVTLITITAHLFFENLFITYSKRFLFF